jgi:L-lysine exporter family protein LysE/ArgO
VVNDSLSPAFSSLPVLHVALAGLVFQLSVIAAVGPQNIVLLKQGVRRRGLAVVVGVFILGDLILLPLGTAGVGVVTDRLPVLLEILRWGGVAYLLWFATTCLRDVRHPRGIDSEPAPDDDTDAGRAGEPTDLGPDAPDTRPDSVPDTGGQVTTATRTVQLRSAARPGPQSPRSPRSRWSGGLALAALPTALAVTFLNPAAYVDGIVVFGTMANQYDDTGRWVFTAGALVGSTLFFLVVGYGARLLSRPLSSPRVWRWINLGIGLLMIGMAARLALG